MMQILTRELPLYVNLVFGFLFLFTFTGTWVLLNDLARLNSEAQNSKNKALIKSAFSNLRIRRMLVLFASIGMFTFYFLDGNTVIFVAVIFGVFWWDTLSLIARSRRFVNAMEKKEGLISTNNGIEIKSNNP